MNKPLIVVVEDEQAIQDVVAYNLRREGYEVLLAGDGDEGLALIQSKRPGLVILDLMLPGIDGLSICQQLRADPKTRSIPLMILSAKEEESDIVIGLSLGADDYLAKPYEPMELVLKIQAILKRVKKDEEKISDFLIKHNGRKVILDGLPIEFTKIESEIFLFLIRNR